MYVLSILLFLKADYVLAMQNDAIEIIKSHILGPVTLQTPDLVLSYILLLPVQFKDTPKTELHNVK